MAQVQQAAHHGPVGTEGHGPDVGPPSQGVGIPQMIHARRQIEVGPTEAQRLGRLTIVALVLNRTVGTGIFVQPSNVLFLTGSPAISVIIWIVGGLIIFAITLSWLELGLSIPRYWIPEREAFFWTPRSAGDKNYLEYIYKKPRQLISCIFAITFILFGNLAGNAIQFGAYMENARQPHCVEGQDCYNRVAVAGWAIFILVLCSVMNIFTRKIFVWAMNFFAGAKLLLVVAVMFLGIVYGAQHGDGCRKNLSWSNRGPGGQFGDIVLAIFYGIYAFTGFEQPFYVMAEIRRPDRYFVKYVLLALAIVAVLFPLTNVSYFCVVPYDGTDSSVPLNMALEFFRIIASGNDPTVDTTASQQGISVLLGLVIFGSMMSQTFTGTLVKQEIGKEAIVPLSRYLARGSDSLLDHYLFPEARRNRKTNANYFEDHPEQVPMAATVLHLSVAVLEVIITSILAVRPSTGYRVLVFLRVFSIIFVLGILTVFGLAYLKIDSWWHGVRSRPRQHMRSPPGNYPADGDYELHWQHEQVDENNLGRQRRGRRWLAKRRWWPWMDPIPTFVACAALLFLSFAICIPPTQTRDDIPYWVNPLAGWLIPILGVLWWAGLRLWQWKTRKITVVDRRPQVRLVGDEAFMRYEKLTFARLYEDQARTLGFID